jgi:hypothetical protein
MIQEIMNRALLALLPVGLAALNLGCSSQRATVREAHANRESARTIEALNALRNDINTRYGYRNAAPRINLGPCGRFARDFRTAWNARFPDPVTIAFIMSTDGSNCRHVLVELPDGNYFDGGGGVMTAAALLNLYPDSRIEHMTQFDHQLLDQRSYGLNRSYFECPNYSDEFTQRTIGKHLNALRDRTE